MSTRWDDDQPEIPLVGGRSSGVVVRKGGRVRRQAGPWTPTVHAYLRHLRSRGFDGCPDVLGIDGEGREVLSFIEGETHAVEQDPTQPLVVAPWPEAWRSDDALGTAARLVRSLHDAAIGFRPERPIWRMADRGLRHDEIVCHADYGPWNAVYRDGVPVALIDWDGCRPDTPLADLAWAAWNFVPLAPDDWCRASGFDDLPDRPARLRLFLDAYGLADRRPVYDAVKLAKFRQMDNLWFWNGIAAGAASGFLTMLANDLRWLDDNGEDLRSVLV